MLSSLFAPLLLFFLPDAPATTARPHAAEAAAPAQPAAALPDYAQVTDDLFIGNRLIQGTMSMAEIKQKRIRTIRQKTTDAGYVCWNTEQFDERGHTVYRRLWNQWPDRPSSGYSHFFACDYAPDGKLIAVAVCADSLRNEVTRRLAYRYTKRGQLKSAGNYRLAYYPDGRLQSVTGGSTEQYHYNAQGQLTRIVFGMEPGLMTCSNRTEEWQGEYDAAHRLSREVHVGLHGHSYELSYNAAGQLIRRTSTDGGWNYECLYTYQNGLLAQAVEKFSGREFDGPQARTTTYTYELY
ncbi:hypothetical protein EJV47_15935 [Hymenobacter gummosus]|uniref:RHS repeat protein n=1 Tax=Hymenobacter gummosus TaxID=1776032 RepID=A0A3S0H849_9BACT|nr:hypothetical protein [Hymenobacter gummosus]RTQ48461.1 hypothetical protein EJV47_15935 [Hymenobacter gummosus]